MNPTDGRPNQRSASENDLHFTLTAQPADVVSVSGFNRDSIPAESSIIGARSCADLNLAQRLLTTLRRPDADRAYRIQRIQSAIHADTYENELKVSVAVDRLLCRLRGEVATS